MSQPSLFGPTTGGSEQRAAPDELVDRQGACVHPAMTLPDFTIISNTAAELSPLAPQPGEPVSGAASRM